MASRYTRSVGRRPAWRVPRWAGSSPALTGTCMITAQGETNMEEASVIVWGQGEPVVLLHASAAADPAFVWPHQRPLAAQYQLLFPTRPGYGGRPVRPRRDLQQDVQEAGRLLEEKGGGHLVGLSYGGLVALDVAARYLALVRSLAVLE